MSSLWINRTVCNMLEEMRQCVKTSNFSYLPGLIEEVQSAANRMEAGLDDKNDWKEYRKKAKAAHKEYRKLEKSIEKATEELAGLKDNLGAPNKSSEY